MIRLNRFLLLSLGFAAVAAIGVALGMWQLSRANYKLALRHAVEAASKLEPLKDADFAARLPNAGDTNRRVQLHGRWLPDQTLYWDNIPMGERVGFVVVTPFKLAQGNGLILVQRGWIPRNFQDRNQLQPIETPAGDSVIEGVVANWPSQRISLGGPEHGPIRQNLPLADFKALLGANLAGVTVRQTGAASLGMLRDWPQADDGVNMHKGYAFQWFSLSALVAAYYFWFQIVKRKQQTQS